MSNNEDLKPCPFCGGEARIVEVGIAHDVGCTNCAEKYWRYGGRSDAIEFWNRCVCSYQNAQKLDTNRLNGVCVSPIAEKLDTKSNNPEKSDSLNANTNFLKNSYWDKIKASEMIRNGIDTQMTAFMRRIDSLIYEDIDRTVKLKWHEYSDGSAACFLPNVVFFLGKNSDFQRYYIMLGGLNMQLYFPTQEEAKKYVHKWVVDLIATALGIRGVPKCS